VQGLEAPVTSVEASASGVAGFTIGFRRTVVFVEYHSQLGEHLFLRGGISHERRSGMMTLVENSLKINNYT